MRHVEVRGIAPLRTPPRGMTEVRGAGVNHEPAGDLSVTHAVACKASLDADVESASAAVAMIDRSSSVLRHSRRLVMPVMSVSRWSN
jgi:hypothetical protein